jgi:hypothetical protein
MPKDRRIVLLREALKQRRVRGAQSTLEKDRRPPKSGWFGLLQPILPLLLHVRMVTIQAVTVKIGEVG